LFSCGGNTRTCKINKKGESSSLLDALICICLPARLPRHVRPRRPLWPPTHRRRSLSPQGHRRKNDHRFVVLLCALGRPLNVRDPDKKPPLSHATYALHATYTCTRTHNTYTELLPNDVTCAKETRDLIIECCVGPSKPYPLTFQIICVLAN
jgi:hypothetical protein